MAAAAAMTTVIEMARPSSRAADSSVLPALMEDGSAPKTKAPGATDAIVEEGTNATRSIPVHSAHSRKPSSRVRVGLGQKVPRVFPACAASRCPVGFPGPPQS